MLGFFLLGLTGVWRAGIVSERCRKELGERIPLQMIDKLARRNAKPINFYQVVEKVQEEAAAVAGQASPVRMRVVCC